METPLQSAEMATTEQPSQALAEQEDEYGFGGEHHIHMPNPSLWPLITAIPIALAIAFFLTWTPGTVPWLSIIFALLILVGIIGWAVQNPFAPRHARRARAGQFATSYAEVETTGELTYPAYQTLMEARRLADQMVTVSSTEWSAHPVNVEVEKEGVILALYGKVELEAQREALEKALLQLPGVLDVRSFLVAEDALLNAVEAKIASLQEAGKLNGAKDLHVYVENYIVNLYGYTPTPEMKYMLEREIIAIPGVRVVVNHIGLDENIPGNLGKTNNKVGK
ncbi:MAG TPA: BON domain-containing protein [Ktedonobacteraceae bacterium]|nr:BON domain-containing protein [Ktedonobacteraceae bacterium]